MDRFYESRIGKLQPGWRVVDIGAALGDFAVYAAKQCSKGEVWAFEPLPGSYELLKTNLELNNCKNVKAYHKAVTGPGKTLSVPREIDVDPAQFSFDLNGSGTEDSLQVECITLNELVDSFGTIDFLKIDCEGAEYEILMSADDSSLAQIKRIALEWHELTPEHDSRALLRFLQDRGFDCEWARNDVHSNIGYLFAIRKG